MPQNWYDVGIDALYIFGFIAFTIAFTVGIHKLKARIGGRTK